MQVRISYNTVTVRYLLHVSIVSVILKNRLRSNPEIVGFNRLSKGTVETSRPGGMLLVLNCYFRKTLSCFQVGTVPMNNRSINLVNPNASWLVHVYCCFLTLEMIIAHLIYLSELVGNIIFA